MTNAIFLPKRYSSNLTIYLKLKNLKDILSLFVYLFARPGCIFYYFCFALHYLFYCFNILILFFKKQYYYIS